MCVRERLLATTEGEREKERESERVGGKEGGRERDEKRNRERGGRTSSARELRHLPMRKRECVCERERERKCVRERARVDLFSERVEAAAHAGKGAEGGR